MIGRTLSHYLIEAELGRGGMGIVYRATDTKLDRTVAIKVLPPSALASEEDRARFYREAKAAAALNHPHIAQIYQIDEAVPEGGSSEEPRPFIAMEFIEGQTLDDLIRQGPVGLKQVVTLAGQVADALSAAHAKGIVHRDIKAGNIMVTKAGRAKVLDFGLAQTTHSTKLTRQGSTLGTIAYMSPEQARGEEVDGRTDLWALGVVLYEMVAGRKPFAADYEQAALYAILNEDPEPLTALRTGVPMELEQITAKLLRKEAAHRYQQAQGLIADLDALSIGASGSHASVRSRAAIAPAASGPTRSGPRGLWIALGMVAALLVGAAGMWLLNRPDSEPRRFHVWSVDGLAGAEIAPDGSGVAWFRADTLFYRPFSSPNESVLYPAGDPREMTWSPDSRSVAVVDGSELKSVRVDGSGTFPIGSLPPAERLQGLVWTPGGRVFVAAQYGAANGEIFEFPAAGGERSSFLSLSTAAGSYSMSDMIWLPGPEVLIGVTRDFTYDQIRVINPENESQERLSEALVDLTSTTTWLGYIAYDPRGYLIYERAEDLWQLQIDPGTGMPEGEPGVLFGGWSEPSISVDGALLAHDFGSPYSEVQARLFDPVTGANRAVGISMEGRVRYPVFNPDGDRIVVSAPDGAKLASLERGDAQRISDRFAVISQWLTDRALVVSAYGSEGNADILQLDPTSRDDPQELVATEESEFYGEVSPDGTTLVYYRVMPETGRDLWTIPVSVSDDGISIAGEASSWFAGPNDDAAPTWHPSGNWVAYMSNETGLFQVYVRSWPDGRATELVSLGEGSSPLWSEDGRALYYRDSDSLYAVAVQSQTPMRFSRPRGLFALRDVGMVISTPLERPIAVRPGTGEILYFESSAWDVVPELVLVENWAAGR